MNLLIALPGRSLLQLSTQLSRSSENSTDLRQPAFLKGRHSALFRLLL